MSHRAPYVGHGAAGARRSAQIDRDEAATLPTGPHQPGYSTSSEARKASLLASADAWEAQARRLETAAARRAREELRRG